jgi:hypothetical protein
VLFLAVGFLIACGGGGGGGESVPADIPDDPAPPQQPAVSSRLESFGSAEALETYLKNGIQSAGSWESGRDDWIPVPDAEGGGFDAAPPAPSPSPDTPVFSGTNLQEAGVDEADIVKTDGAHLYLLVTPDIAYPGFPEIAVEPALDILPPPVERPYLRILSLSENPPGSREVARISLDQFENTVESLYLLTNRGEGRPDLLVTIGGSAADPWGDWFCPFCWQNGITEIGLFNVEDPARPAEISRVTLDGRLISSRRIENRLYLVTRYTPAVPEYDPYAADPETQARNEAVLASVTLSDLLPRMAVDGADSGPLVTPERSFLPPREEEALPEPGMITVTALNLDRPSDRSTQSVAGAAETLYVSRESLYVATTRNPYIAPVEPWAEDAVPDEFPPPKTEIHKFSLTEAGPVYAGSGEVVGNLGWGTGKRPFRMSESDGILRVATSLGDTWTGTARTRLNLLREGEGGTLEETAYVDHIGKPGERLYASRFVGDRGFLVTFRVTDPLYVFDLSDPANPRAVGELEIEGYSDYLHPIGENLLLGIGKDAVPAEEGDLGGRGAWYQGVKLSLFDVSDPARPFEIDAMVFGRRGTDSEVLMDHHALAYLPPMSDGAPARMAVPIRLHDTPGNPDWFDPSNPSAYWEWTRTGLYLFEIDSAGLSRAGEMIVADRADGEEPGWNFSGDRSVLLGDSAHFVHDGGAWSATWGVPNGVEGPN